MRARRPATGADSTKRSWLRVSPWSSTVTRIGPACTSAASTSTGDGIHSTTSSATSAIATTANRTRFRVIEGSDPCVECLIRAS